MPENMRYLGLCLTCKNASSCTFLRDPDKPVFYCEEFEIEKTSSIMPSGIEEPLATEPAAAKDKDLTKFIGLCSDCEHFQSRKGVSGIARSTDEVRGQTTEDRGQTTEVRGQTSEDRGQTTEDRGQTSEDRGQTTEDR